MNLSTGSPAAFYQGRRVLLIGANGFVGLHGVVALQRLAADLFISTRGPSALASGFAGRWFRGDLGDPVFVRRILRETQPLLVLQFAGLTPGRSPIDAGALFESNVLGTFHLLTALQQEAPRVTSLLVGSSGVYRQPERGQTISEGHGVAPTSDYSKSKLLQEMIAVGFGHEFGLPIVRARTFNLVGPGEPPGLVCSSFARQLAAAELGLSDATVSVGRLDSWRDFTDVRDAVAAYLLLGEKGRPGEVYNVCSGRAVQIGEILDRLLGLARVRARVVPKSARPEAPGDVDSQRGNYDKLHAETGWEPRVSLEQSLADLLDWWRERLKEQGPR